MHRVIWVVFIAFNKLVKPLRKKIHWLLWALWEILRLMVVLHYSKANCPNDKNQGKLTITTSSDNTLQ